jgi:hypothetical protein
MAFFSHNLMTLEMMMENGCPVLHSVELLWLVRDLNFVVCARWVTPLCIIIIIIIIIIFTIIIIMR